MEKQISQTQLREVLAAFVKVTRHARNFPHPEIPITLLRSEGVDAESLAEQILGKDEYRLICKIAFKK